MFFAGIAWLTVLLGVAVVSVGRARTTAERLVALDTAVLMLLGLVAAESRRAYAWTPRSRWPCCRSCPPWPRRATWATGGRSPSPRREIPRDRMLAGVLVVAGLAVMTLGVYGTTPVAAHAIAQAAYHRREPMRAPGAIESGNCPGATTPPRHGSPGA
jgi:hypothetical protein